MFGHRVRMESASGAGLMSSATLTSQRCNLAAPTIRDTPLIATLMTHSDVRQYLGGPVAAEHIESRIAQLIDGKRSPSWVFDLRDNASGGVGLIEISSYRDGDDFEISYEFLPTVADRWCAMCRNREPMSCRCARRSSGWRASMGRTATG